MRCMTDNEEPLNRHVGMGNRLELEEIRERELTIFPIGLDISYSPDWPSMLL